MAFLLVFLIFQAVVVGAFLLLLGALLLLLLRAAPLHTASVLDPRGSRGLTANLLFQGPSVTMHSVFRGVALLPVAGGWMATLSRGVRIFHPVAGDFRLMLLWVALLTAPVARGLVACNVAASLDRELLLPAFLLPSRAVVGVSGNLVPVVGGHILFLTFLVSVALVPVVRDVMMVLI